MEVFYEIVGPQWGHIPLLWARCNMKIAQLLPTTLIEYPGKVSALIYTAGCNFRCPFCHNSELVLPEQIKTLRLIPENDVLYFLRERQGFLDALAITGGEPTLHQDLPEFLRKVKDLGFLVKLDSNGSNPAMLETVLRRGLADYIAMDVKAPWPKYEGIIGVKMDLKKLKASIDVIKEFAPDYEFRTTVAPTLTQEDLYEIAEGVKGANHYYLQEFQTYEDKDLLDPLWNKKKGLPKADLIEVWEGIKNMFGSGGVR